jgi:3'-phosphoadenosine 5'-phosphosulfate sulfotransferase (PAPS reductase)/FAD synthetase
MKHASYDLAQMQSLPLEAKIIMSQQRIRQWYDYWGGNVYVSVAGKDSNVLKHLVKTTSGVGEVPSVFVNTGLEYPEVRLFNTSQSDVTVITPKMRFDQVIEKYGYPVATKEQAAFIYECKNTKSEKLRDIRLNGNKWGRGKISKRWLPLLDAPFKVSDKCCDVMKKDPVKAYEKATGRKPILGTMAYESKQRESNWIMYGCNAFEKKRPTSQPMSFWTEQDVLEYIAKFNVPIPSVYGEVKMDESGKYYTTGADRTGCMFCMFGCHLEKEPNRFQRIKETHPKQYDYCMNNLGLKEVLDYIGVDYE